MSNRSKSNKPVEKEKNTSKSSSTTKKGGPVESDKSKKQRKIIEEFSSEHEPAALSSREEDSSLSDGLNDNELGEELNLEEANTGADMGGELELDANAKAAVPWDTAEFAIIFSAKLSDLLDPSSKMRLEKDGSIMFSVANKRLRPGFCTNAADFASSAAPGNRDIVKSIKIRKFTCNTTSWFVISVPSIPKFMSESFFDNAPHVAKGVEPYSISATKPSDLDVLKRHITNAVVQFQNRYPGVHAGSIKDHIQKCNDRVSFIKEDSPMVELINEYLKGKGYEPLSHSSEVPNKMVAPTKLALKFEKKTTKLMQTLISCGNVTSGFALKMHQPIPEDRLEEHRKWLKNKDTGRPFLGFAEEAKMMMRENVSLSGPLNEYVESKAKEQRLNVNGTAVIKYKRITDSKIELSS